MPIKPENRARYPKDWKAIAASIRERAAVPLHPGMAERNQSGASGLSHPEMKNPRQPEGQRGDTLAQGASISRISVTCAGCSGPAAFQLLRPPTRTASHISQPGAIWSPLARIASRNTASA